MKGFPTCLYSTRKDMSQHVCQLYLLPFLCDKKMIFFFNKTNWEGYTFFNFHEVTILESHAVCVSERESPGNLVSMSQISEVLPSKWFHHSKIIDKTHDLRILIAPFYFYFYHRHWAASYTCRLSFGLLMPHSTTTGNLQLFKSVSGKTMSTTLAPEADLTR